MPGDVEVQNTSTIMADDEKTVQHTEGDRRHREEIHRRNGFAVISEKREPALRRIRISWRSVHPAGDCSLGNIEPEHEKLAVNARGSPNRILGDHAENQIPYLLGGLFSPTVPLDSRNQPPIKTKSNSVPADHCFRRDDDEGLLPTGPDSTSNCPEKPVESAKPRPWMAPL